MTKKNQDEAAVMEQPVKASKSRPSAKKAAAGAVKKESGKGSFDFVGKVESIVAAGEKEGGVFEFGLHGRHGRRQTFRLRTSDSFALAIMAPIVMAAHATETKIGVRVVPAETGAPFVVEVVSRPKLGKLA